MSRQIIHVDMDAFYASVEIRDCPELADKPVIVGGRPDQRGVVSAANYIARQYGVHSAMPTATALRLCPQAVLLRGRHGFYAEVSQQIHAIFERYTPQVEPLSLDEAFLDVTASLRLFGSAEEIGRAIKQAIKDELNLVASVGVATNKYLAKLASDIDKPDGFVVVKDEEIETFLTPLPVSRIWGVGKVAAKTFEKLGIMTIGQLRAYSPQLLRRHFGGSGEHFLQLAHGIDDRPVVSEHEAKSVSNETTFAVDIDDKEILLEWLHALTEQVTQRLRSQGLKGRTIQLKVRFADFTTLTRSQSLESATDVTAKVWKIVGELFYNRLPWPLQPVRLVGVGVSNFDGEVPGSQPDLFDEVDDGRQKKLDQLLDTMQSRFGRSVVHRGKKPG